MKPFFPAYLNLAQGDLEKRITIATSMLLECRLCARACEINRLSKSAGSSKCATGSRARLITYSQNFSEEKLLIGERGSGVIFFGGLSLKYQFSPNYEVHKGEKGIEVDPEQLAAIMLELQDLGCHNINLVSPGHVVPQILESLKVALRAGFALPLVFNSDGYESISTLRLLDGIVDIYVVDMRYGDPAVAERFSHVADYVTVNRETAREMHRQVGDLVVGEDGIAKHGLIIRHMILPRNLAGTDDVSWFIVDELSPDSYVNIIRRYRPSLGNTVPEMNRPITDQEYAAALQWVKHVGLHRISPEIEMRKQANTEPT